MSRSQVGILVFLSIGVCVTGLLLVGLLTRRPSPEVPVPETTETITETVTTSKGTFTVPGTAYIDGRDPAAEPPLTVMSLNVWTGEPHLSTSACKLAHGTQVKLLNMKRYPGPYIGYYFFVESNGCRGWIDDILLSPTYQLPIGDRF